MFAGVFKAKMRRTRLVNLFLSSIDGIFERFIDAKFSIIRYPIGVGYSEFVKFHDEEWAYCREERL